MGGITSRKASLRTPPAIAAAVGCVLLSGSVRAIDHSVGGPCGATIQACIDFANPGDTVLVPAGTYIESLLLTKAVSLVGDDSATTVVSASGLGARVLLIDGASIDPSVRIERLTFADGDVSDGNVCAAGFDLTNCGGGILLEGQARPAIRDVVIRDNRAREGGGLYAEAGSPLTLTDVSFSANASVVGGGGAFFDDPVTLLTCNFDGNVSEASVGGAMMMEVQGATPEGPSEIRGTSFTNNTANSSGSGSTSHGGAVFVFAVDLTVVDSHFENNRCIGECDGGALYASTSFFPVTLTLDETAFIGNSAGRSGGGANLSGLGAQLSVNGSSFESNSASNGGALHSSGAPEIVGTDFTGNTATAAAFPSADGEGGAVYSQQCPELLEGSRFENNSAVWGGGLACASGSATIGGTDFVGNTADENGGGFWGESAELEVAGATFSGNRSLNGDGGGVYVWGNLDMSATSFTGGSLSASGTSFLSNTATSLRGGGALVTGSAGLNSVLFDDNQSGKSGGGILTFGALTISGTSLFFNNRAIDGNGGGASAVETADIDGATFSGNSATGSGGGLSTGEATTVTASQFTDNSANGNGGGASLSGAIVVIGCSFLRNDSGTSGGGLNGLIGFDSMTVRESEFRDNTAVGDGGGLNSGQHVTLEDSIFHDNATSSGRGGGLSTSGLVTVTGTTEFVGNMAFADGGGIFANSGADLTGTLFQNNITTGGNGGGISAALGDLITDGAVFLDNQAVDGGGAFTFDAEWVRDTTFEGNIAQDQGGALWIRRNGTIETSRFSGNQAGLSGGGIYRDGTGSTPLAIDTSTFETNVAGAVGGGITNNSRPLDLTNVTLSENSAGGKGDALYVDGASEIALQNATVLAGPGALVDTVFISGASTVSWTNTLVAGNCLNDGSTFVSGGGNLESEGDTCEFGEPTDQANVAAATLNLDPLLQDNGGPTPTHALLPGSPGVDAGVTPCPRTDQRGSLRFDGSCDVGAYELVPPLLEFVLTLQDDLLTWTDISDSLSYDLIRGELGVLRASGGDFSAATTECLADNHPTTSLSYSPDPASQQGFWFLVRQVTAVAAGTYDSGGPAQIEARDAEVAASGQDCP